MGTKNTVNLLLPLAGLLHKDWGSPRSLRKAPAFYGLVMFGTVGGMALTLAHANPVKLLVLVAVIRGVIAAPLLAVVMLVSESRRIMGRHYVNGLLAKVLDWLTTFVMAAAAVGLSATGGVSL